LVESTDTSHTRLTVLTVAVAVAIAVALLSVAGLVAAQSVSEGGVEDVRTNLADTDGDGLDDRVVVNATASVPQSTVTKVEISGTEFDVNVSPTDTTDGGQARFVSPLDTDGDGTGESVRFTSVGSLNSTYTVVADLSGQSDGEVGTVGVEVTGGATATANFTVRGYETETLTVVTGDEGDTVESVSRTRGSFGNSTGAGETNTTADAVRAVRTVRTTHTTGASGATNVQVLPGGVSEVRVNGRREAMTVGRGRLDLADDEATRDRRAVLNGETVFLGERIDKSSGVFRDADVDNDLQRELISPIMFRETDGDGRLRVPKAVVDTDNARTTYGFDTDGDDSFDRRVYVREPRIQGLGIVDTRQEPGRRLSRFGTPTVEAGESNLQVAVDYNFFESTGLETDGLLTRDGVDVTERYLERNPADTNLTTRDRGVDGTTQVGEPAGPEVPGDDGGAYDAVFTFGIDEPGEYTVNAAPLTGRSRADGRNVGFDTMGNATQSAVVRVTEGG